MTTTTASTSPYRLHPKLWAGAALALALPAAAMLFSAEVDWGLEDFGIFGLMLVGLCAGIEAAINWLTAPRWRIGAIMLGILLFLTVWVHLAVNLFD
jgi:hypothetical protein